MLSDSTSDYYEDEEDDDISFRKRQANWLSSLDLDFFLGAALNVLGCGVPFLFLSYKYPYLSLLPRLIILIKKKMSTCTH